MSRKTIFNVWKQYTETATTSSKPIAGWRRSIRTKPIVQAVMKRVKRNPRRSMRKTASRLRISRSSIHRIFKNDQRLTAYREQQRHLLPAAFKQKRHDKGNRMLAEMQCTVDHVFIWFDEKIFTVEAVTNTQNDWLCMRVMQGICMKVVVSICAVWNQQEWWCGPQSLLMDPSPLRSSRRKSATLDHKKLSKPLRFYSRRCSHHSAVVQRSFHTSTARVDTPLHRPLVSKMSLHQFFNLK